MGSRPRIQVDLKNERDWKAIDTAASETCLSKNKLISIAVNHYLNEKAPNRTKEELYKAFDTKKQ